MAADSKSLFQALVPSCTAARVSAAGQPGVSVSSVPSSISVRVSYDGHFREHGHYCGQKHALHQQTLDHHRTQPAV
ncbi:hypothetical protein DOT37_23360 [Pantoea agglomerans]|nr:hypothetical protein DOT37_23360 [Pantoea agglomerans]